MNYKFPEIRTIDDVLPHIKDREEFIVAEREFGTVINYVVSMEDTFPPVKVAGGSAKMRRERELAYAIRRECRGLIFYPDGRIMSRPFHKFFNVGEKEETQFKKIDLTQPHVIMEKMDGSMIRPIHVGSQVKLATKMGLSDVAVKAQEWLDAHTKRDSMLDYLRLCMIHDYTPLFEFVSPDNQIVLNYEKADLVLLAIRDNVTGEYLPYSELDQEYFSVVRTYGSVKDSLEEYVERQRLAENREGDIIRFADGHMLKIKNNWYVRIHKALDRVRFDRNIVDLIINENLDDVVPMMPQVEIERIRDFEHRFWVAFKQKENRLYGQYLNATKTYRGDKKRIALELVPKLEHKSDAAFIFRMVDGYDLRDMMIEHVRKGIGTNVKWDACASWMGMERK